MILFLLKHVSQKQYHSVNEQTRGISPASLSNLAYLFQFLFVNELDFPSVDDNQFLGGKVGQGSDGIGSGHVGKVGQVFSGEIDAQSTLVFFHTVGIFQEKQ